MKPRPWLPLALATSLLLLSGCAVDPNNGRNLLDLDEVTATQIQSFALSQKNGVLRRTVQGRFQLKLYDRNGVINLPAEPSGYLISHSSVLPDGATVLVLNAPRPNCSGHSYIYLLRASAAESRVMETNQCGPLDFQTDPAGPLWLAQARSPVANGLLWVVRDGQLFSAQDPRQAPAADRKAGAPGQAPGAPGRPGGGTALPQANGWHIEHGGSSKPAPAPAPPSNSSSASNASGAKANNSAGAGNNTNAANTAASANSRFILPTKALEPASLPQAQSVVIDIKK
jgi:hypothetical protein